MSKTAAEKASGHKILLGISGGIAAYRAADLARELMRAGCTVKVAMTKNAQAFITPLTFESLTGQPVYSDLFGKESFATEHISLARWADLFLVAPATANILAKFARGIADDLLSTAWLSHLGRKLVAPAMNPAMLTDETTRDNLERLAAQGVRVLPTQAGLLPCGEEGYGKLLDPAQIAAAALEELEAATSLAGVRLLLTAGPTREPLDAFRFLSNPSSGKMGAAIAREALLRGAEVTVVHGPLAVPLPLRAKAVAVTTAREMLAACQERIAAADIFIGCAAVSDFRPASAASGKVSRGQAPRSLTLVENPDILKTLAAAKRSGQLFVGFAAESDDPLPRGRSKLQEKNLDLLVANRIGGEESAFGADRVWAALLTAGGETELFEQIGKHRLAAALCQRLAELRSPPRKD